MLKADKEFRIELGFGGAESLDAAKREVDT